MKQNPDDFKARALAILGIEDKRITTLDRHKLWKIATTFDDLTGRDRAILEAIAAKIQPQEAVA